MLITGTTTVDEIQTLIKKGVVIYVTGGRGQGEPQTCRLTKVEMSEAYREPHIVTSIEGDPANRAVRSNKSLFHKLADARRYQLATIMERAGELSALIEAEEKF